MPTQRTADGEERGGGRCGREGGDQYGGSDVNSEEMAVLNVTTEMIEVLAVIVAAAYTM